MTGKKIILYILMGVLAFIFLFATWYKHTYSMEKIPSFEVNSPTNQTKLLIATQGSEYKNALTNNIVNYYKNESIYIKVIDVSKLNEIEVEDFNALLIIHTWENTKPPVEVEKFIENNKKLNSITIIYTTSGNGSNKMEQVDALTGESKIENIKEVSNQIIKKLQAIL